jgi:hypothetical protein
MHATRPSHRKLTATHRAGRYRCARCGVHPNRVAERSTAVRRIDVEEISVRKFAVEIDYVHAARRIDGSLRLNASAR